MESDESKRYKELLRDYRASLESGLHEQYRSADKAILTLAAGALGLSLTFLSKETAAGTAWLVRVAWVFLTFSITSTLMSFRASQKACEMQMKKVEKEYIENQVIEANAEANERVQTKEVKCVAFWNLVSLYGFLIGIVLLLAFGMFNI